MLEAFENVHYRRGSLYELAEWYDVDYAGYKGEESFYRMLVTQHVERGEAYVELGAGTGRLALRFALDGHRVHGVEPSAGMRARFLHKLAGLDLPEGLVSLEAAEGGSFSGPHDAPAALIAFPFNGLLHVYGHASLDATFARVKEQLAPGGVFALDITSPAWEEMSLGGRPWGRLDERVHPETGERLLTCDRCTYLPRTRVMHTDYRFVVEGEPRGVEVFIDQYMWTYQEVLHALARHGFEIEMLFGDVDFAPFIEKGPRMMVAARSKS